MYVCSCYGIKESEIKKLIKSGKKTVWDIMADTGAGSSCGACLTLIGELIKENAMDDELKDFEGLTEAAARKLISVAVWVRVMEKDQPMTAEFKPNRLNLVMDNGIVLRAFWG